MQFRHLRVTLQGKSHINVCLSLSEDGLCLFDSASGASMAAITCEEEIQVCVCVCVMRMYVCMAVHSRRISEDRLCLFDSASGASMAAITCEEEIQVCIYMSVCNVNVCMFQCSICLCLM